MQIELRQPFYKLLYYKLKMDRKKNMQNTTQKSLVCRSPAGLIFCEVLPHNLCSSLFLLQNRLSFLQLLFCCLFWYRGQRLVVVVSWQGSTCGNRHVDLSMATLVQFASECGDYHSGSTEGKTADG